MEEVVAEKVEELLEDSLVEREERTKREKKPYVF